MGKEGRGLIWTLTFLFLLDVDLAVIGGLQ